jgi:hypothetical protein
MQNKVVIPGKVDKVNNKKHKIRKHNDTEIDITIDLTSDGDYVVEKLSIDGLPTTMSDNTSIRWFNNFGVKKNGQYIKEKYVVTIPNLGKSRLVIYSGSGDPYYHTGAITNNTIELNDGDPAMGMAP